MKFGDIIIFPEVNTIRGNWKMFRVMQIYCDDTEFMWSVKWKIENVDPADSNIITLLFYIEKTSN